MTSDIAKGTFPALVIFLLFVSGVFISAGCEESLPPREAPREYLAPAIAADTSIIVIHLREERPPPLVTQAFAVHGTIRNITDEVIEDTAEVSIVLTISSESSPPYRVTLRGNSGNLQGPIQVRNGVLTLEPRYPAAFRLVWNDWRWTGGVGVWVPWWYEMKAHVDPQGVPYDESPAIPIDVEANVQLFKNSAPLKWKGLLYMVVRLYPDAH